MFFDLCVFAPYIQVRKQKTDHLANRLFQTLATVQIPPIANVCNDWQRYFFTFKTIFFMSEYRVFIEKEPTFSELSRAVEKLTEENEKLRKDNKVMGETIKAFIDHDLQAYEYVGFLVVFENQTVSVARRDGMEVSIGENEIHCSISKHNRHA